MEATSYSGGMDTAELCRGNCKSMLHAEFENLRIWEFGSRQCMRVVAASKGLDFDFGMNGVLNLASISACVVVAARKAGLHLDECMRAEVVNLAERSSMLGIRQLE